MSKSIGKGPTAPDVKTGNGYTKSGGLTMTGNRIQVHIGGRIVGLIQSMTCSDSYGLQGATRLGRIEVVEFVPTEAAYSLQVSMMVLSRDTLYLTAGDATRLIPETGSKNGNMRAAIDGMEMDIVVSDINGNVLAFYGGCVYDSGSVDFTANRIVVSQATFRAKTRWGVLRA